MTREEAIEIIRRYECNSEHYEACEMAIKALEQDQCDDAVSREAVLDLCDSKDPNYLAIHFKEDVECLPSVRPQETVTEFADRCRECGARYGKLLKQVPKTGHWIKKGRI